MTFERIFGAGAIGIVVLGVALAFYTIGGPGHARSVQFDERRSGDLHGLAESIVERYPDKGRPLPFGLPSNLMPYNQNAENDPETGKPYVYERVGPQTFRLCATFALASSETIGSVEANHTAGRVCFSYDTKKLGR